MRVRGAREREKEKLELGHNHWNRAAAAAVVVSEFGSLKLQLSELEIRKFLSVFQSLSIYLLKIGPFPASYFYFCLFNIGDRK